VVPGGAVILGGVYGIDVRAEGPTSMMRAERRLSDYQRAELAFMNSNDRLTGLRLFEKCYVVNNPRDRTDRIALANVITHARNVMIFRRAMGTDHPGQPL
jgi:hypothetical protein